MSKPTDSSRSVLRIATRKSQLAMWQTQHVAKLLAEVHPQLDVEIIPLSTRGDEILDKPLAKIGGKGLFLKALEVAMLEGLADLAVHSLKDVPAQLEPGFELGAILARADASDAFVSNHYDNFDELPRQARVGTSSLRRQAQVRALRPDVEILTLRGNVNTRLAKLDRGDYDAIILATCGLERLQLEQRIRTRMDTSQWLPAPGQAAIAIEIREGDEHTRSLLANLHDAPTARTVGAERAMNQKLGGSCSVPIGAWCEQSGDTLTLQGSVGDTASGQLLRAKHSGPADDPQALGIKVAQALLDQGAAQFLDL